MPGVGGLSSVSTADNGESDNSNDDLDDEDINSFETPRASTDPPEAVTPSVAVAKK